ncbi:MAG: hypothetical protein WAV56_04030 [Microgenomates group bacterium]
MSEQEVISNNDETESEEVNSLTVGLFDDYVSDQIEGARRAAEGCGCSSCRNAYKEWLEWVQLDKGIGEKKFVDNAPIGDGDDDGPPDINSGNLADWYSKDF